MTISEPLKDDIKDYLTSGRELEIVAHSQLGIDWIIVAVHDLTTPADSKWWIYDVAASQATQSPVWHTPWTGIPSLAIVSGKLTEASVSRELGVITSGSGTSALCVYNDALYTDTIPGSADANIAFDFETNLFPIPTGNHIHRLREEEQTSSLWALKLEWLNGETTPVVEYALDDIINLTTASLSTDSTIHGTPVGYDSKHFFVDTMAERARVAISRSADSQAFELETIAFLWQIPMGA